MLLFQPYWEHALSGFWDTHSAITLLHSVRSTFILSFLKYMANLLLITVPFLTMGLLAG